jgi:Dyp-type peroxidase family
MIQLELQDIQGYLIRGYAHMQYSRFVFLSIKEPSSTKKWLSDLWKSVTNAVHIPDHSCIAPTHLNLALTFEGLQVLGLKDENATSFSREFRQGMVTRHRTRLLGDFDSSAPENWRWGGPQNHPVHLVLMVFGNTQELCLSYYQTLCSGFAGFGVQELLYIDGQTLPENKEHFGFRDGISQPVIEGSGRMGPENDIIKAGEFVLGYKNEYGVYPDTPLIAMEQGELNLLAPDADGSGKKDLGRNGTYMVIRQLEQHVDAFWTFMNESTKNEEGSINEEESVRLAAKIVGRWPSGAPITKFPEKDPGKVSSNNEFGFAEGDKDGLKCPFGSHIRRTNPRDSFEDNNKKESLVLSNRHRIMRRARLYGKPFVGSPRNQSPEGEVGSLFSCFNADISRQFEFIQYTWSNYPRIKELYSDPDPIIGVKEIPKAGIEQNFTVQELPINRTVRNLKRFVTVRGGGYFFLPSITGIRYLATI